MAFQVVKIAKLYAQEKDDRIKELEDILTKVSEMDVMEFVSFKITLKKLITE